MSIMLMYIPFPFLLPGENFNIRASTTFEPFSPALNGNVCRRAVIDFVGQPPLKYSPLNASITESKNKRYENINYYIIRHLFINDNYYNILKKILFCFVYNIII